MKVESSLEAQGYVSFTIREPALGVPDLIQVDDPEGVGKDEASVAFVYQNLSFNGQELGPVDIEESPPDGHSVDQFYSIVATPPRGASPGAFQIVSVNGQDALLVSGNGVGRVLWIGDGVLLQVLGQTISPDQAIAIAEAL